MKKEIFERHTCRGSLFCEIAKIRFKARIIKL